jgi:hypothetical protein
MIPAWRTLAGRATRKAHIRFTHLAFGHRTKKLEHGVGGIGLSAEHPVRQPDHLWIIHACQRAIGPLA